MYEKGKMSEHQRDKLYSGKMLSLFNKLFVLQDDCIFFKLQKKEKKN